MGCANSRLDDLPAVSLCRERCKYLDEALTNGHDFADAHVAYLESLRSLAPTLASFFALRNQSNGGDEKKPTPTILHSATPDHSNSTSDSSESHLRFPSDSDESDSEKDEKQRSYKLNEDETRRLIAQNFGFGSGDLASSKPAPAPPSPPPAASIGSAWDLFNFFEPFEKYERLCVEREDSEKIAAAKVSEARGGSGETTTFEVKVVEKSRKEASERVVRSESSSAPSCVGVVEAMSEIQVLFVRASESGNEVLKLIYYGIANVNGQDNFRLCFDEDFCVSSRNLSSTLKKISLWEKKLYCEVKGEEKLRLVYQKKLKELKYLDREIAKTHKANSTRAVVRDLTTKLKIAFQMVDRISIAINKVRDQELWPQIKELNYRLLPMWKTMLECHKSQHQKIIQIKGLNSITSSEKLYNADIKTTIQLKLELQTYNLSFSNWVLTLKDYVKSLNGWLTRCLLYEPEETPDGMMPFSPGRLGAPAVFVICNHWSHAIDRISENEVIGAIQGFVARIDALLKEHNVDIQQIMIADKEVERRFKMLERQELKIQRKKGLINRSEVIRCSDLQQGLKQIFMAVETFMANSIQVYEELRLRIEEVRECEHSSDKIE